MRLSEIEDPTRKAQTNGFFGPKAGRIGEGNRKRGPRVDGLTERVEFGGQTQLPVTGRGKRRAHAPFGEAKLMVRPKTAATECCAEQEEPGKTCSKAKVVCGAKRPALKRVKAAQKEKADPR